MLGIRKRIATYKRIADFSHTLETVKLSNQPSKYLLDIMASYQSRSKVTQSQEIQHMLSVGHLEPTIEDIEEDIP